MTWTSLAIHKPRMIQGRALYFIDWQRPTGVVCSCSPQASVEVSTVGVWVPASTWAAFMKIGGLGLAAGSGFSFPRGYIIVLNDRTYIHYVTSCIGLYARFAADKEGW